MPGGSRDSDFHTFSVPVGSADGSGNSSVSIGYLPKKNMNAERCREYRKRSTVKKELENREFQQELSRNIKLRAVYDKSAKKIEKLRTFYLQCLNNKRFKCAEMVKHSQFSTSSTLAGAQRANKSDHNMEQPALHPMVTMKLEGVVLITDIKTEVEEINIVI